MKWIFLLLLSCAGCSSTNISRLVTALGKDRATVVHKVSTIYGTSFFVRIGDSTNTSTTVTPDGTVTVKSN